MKLPKNWAIFSRSYPNTSATSNPAEKNFGLELARTTPRIAESDRAWFTPAINSSTIFQPIAFAFPCARVITRILPSISHLMFSILENLQSLGPLLVVSVLNHDAHADFVCHQHRSSQSRPFEATRRAAISLTTRAARSSIPS